MRAGPRLAGVLKIGSGPVEIRTVLDPSSASDPEDARSNALHSFERTCAPGEVIFEPGDEGVSLFVVQAGEVELTRPVDLTDDLSLEELHLDPLFPALYRAYERQPIGRAVLRNTGDSPAEELALTTSLATFS